MGLIGIYNIDRMGLIGTYLVPLHEALQPVVLGLAYEVPGV
jgi:hypothetical protein